MVLSVTYDAHRYPKLCCDHSLGYCVLRVISSFAVRVGPQITQHAFRGQIIEDNHIIDGLKRRYQLRTRLLRKQGPPGTFEGRDCPVAVYTDDQHVSLRVRTLKKTDVAHM